MPQRTDIHKVLIIGSGPIIIGQACEFDYSGTQACKALRKLGYQIVLVNSNPATIMTDPEMADVTYIEPLNVERMEEIIAKESKTSYEDYVSQHIFTPLHMTKSCFVSDENTSIPYTGTEQSAKLLCGGVGYSSLGMITNVSNLLELIDGLMTNSIISEATFKKLFTDYGGGYGYGVYVSGIRATGIGGIDAFSAKMSFTTNNNQIYVALSNDSESNPDKIHTLFRDYLMKFRN